MERRTFCSRITALSASALAAHQAGGAAQQKISAAPDSMPQIPFGKYRVSRLVLGANPFHAGSHLSIFVNQEMRTYYTLEQKLKTLRRCEAVGISLWQGSDDHHWVYRQYREQGGRMLYISLGRCDVPTAEHYLKQLLDVGCIGIAHHGEVTDSLFKAGKLDRIHDYLKRVRDAGVLVGVSTHMPDVVDAVESKGWDIDFYMTCVYERHRTREELKKLMGYVPIPVREVYLEEDPPRMFKAMRQTQRTCFAFKILAAGRLCDRKESVEQAFRQTFESIKPTDGVIVGIYDKFSDQAGEDAEYTRRFSALSHA